MVIALLTQSLPPCAWAMGVDRRCGAGVGGGRAYPRPSAALRYRCLLAGRQHGAIGDRPGWAVRLSPDRLIIGHGDNDHAGGSQDFPDDVLRLSGEPEQVPGSQPCIAGQQWQWDGVRFSVLWPQPAPDGNDASCVLVEGNGWRVLLPGDIGREVEYRLLGQWPRAQLLVLAHHGSKSVPRRPCCGNAGALASAGYRHYFGHPTPMVGVWSGPESQFCVQTGTA